MSADRQDLRLDVHVVEGVVEDARVRVVLRIEHRHELIVDLTPVMELVDLTFEALEPLGCPLVEEIVDPARTLAVSGYVLSHEPAAASRTAPTRSRASASPNPAAESARSIPEV